MKKIFFLGFLVILANLCCFSFSKDCTDTVINYKLFSITIPKEFNGQYCVKKSSNAIMIFDKKSKKAGFGGFAFGIRMYKTPSEHALLPGGRKIGELTDKKGNLYDMVLKHPTDVQYDYTKGEDIPDSYKKLYYFGELVEIKGIKGATYYKNQGMKGEDLYKEVLKKHITAIKEKWDSKKLEQENMSYMYNVIACGFGNKTKDVPQKVLEKVGYIFYDVNADGIDELFIGEISDGERKGIIYDIYTMVDREPKHVVSGGNRERYFVCDDVFICQEASGGANESLVRIYNLVENTTELFPQVSFKYDGYQNPFRPWFLSYAEEKWENVPETVYQDRKSVFVRYSRFEFIPSSKVKY